ncbi:MAG: hypothetical protein EA367_01510 [Leptolyngbya sp. DLM2.Bin15]|nr:MAG: hypothetical protein EA367_01510 [Leptolyngbya sp. DLM2.Bin15]
MRVLTSSAQHLVLQLRPWSLWLFGGAFTLFGLLPALLIAEVATLECHRTAQPPSCELSRAGLLKNDRHLILLDHFQGVEVQESRSDDSSTYRVVLLTSEGDRPLTGYYSSGYAGKARQARQIDAFLTDLSQTQLVIQQDSRWLGYLFTLIFSGSGLLVLCLMGNVVTCEFDKLGQSFKLTRRGLLGSKIIKHPLHHIQTVHLETSHGSKGSTTYRVALDLKNGDRLPITTYYSSGRKDKQKTADQISAFLGLTTSTPLSLWNLDLREFLRLLTGGQQVRQQSIVRYRETLEREPGNLQTQMNLIAALWLEGQRDEAIATVEDLKSSLTAQGKAGEAAKLDDYFQTVMDKAPDTK